MKKIIFLFWAAALMLTAFGQELPRGASFGASIIDLKDSTMAELKLSSKSGTLIKKIFDGSAAQQAGFAVDDVLISVDGEKIENTNGFIQLLKKHHGGDKIKIGFYR